MVFGGYDDNPNKLVKNKEGQIPVEIIPRKTGKALMPDDFTSTFVAYYPEFDSLRCEGGHSSDQSYDLSSGDTTEAVGIRNTSPRQTFRLNGYFEGQECEPHFIRQKKNGHYQKIASLDKEFQKQTNIVHCKIRNQF